MEAPSQLEMFLNTHRADGKMMEQEGSFTLAREKALQKLAGFQLPFEGAWAVKVVQSACRINNQSRIQIQQTVRETRFGFDCPVNWTLDSLEAAFFRPEPGPDPAVNHLMSALWTVGVGKKRGFLLTLPELVEGLLWDGQSMHRLPLNEPIGCSLTVSHRPSDHSLKHWISDPGLSRRLNVEVATALSERCFTCPVPLLLDGRRLDGFHLCPTHGWVGDSFPFYLEFLQGLEGEVAIPRGTLDTLDVASKKDAISPGLHVMSVEAFKAIQNERVCSGVLLLAAHAGQARSRKYSKWETRKAASICYWVADGVVVDSDVIDVPVSSCSVAIFLDASDLRKDISGLRVVADTARAARLIQGTRAVKEHLGKVAHSVFKTVVAEAGKQGHVAGGAIVLLGTGMLFASPFHGFLCMGAGLLTIKNSGKEEKELVSTYGQDLRSLVRDWPD